MDELFETNQPEAEVQPAETPVEEAPVAQEAPAKPEWVETYAASTEAQFQNLRALIKYTKTKDESIAKLSGELQKYREDYCAKSFKPLAMAAISFREDCRKSLADMEKYPLDMAKVKKYLDYLADDYFEMLSNVGIEEEDDVWMYNGSVLRDLTETPAPAFQGSFEVAEAEDAQLSCANVATGEELLAYLDATQGEIRKILARNEQLDRCLKEYIAFSLHVEKDLVRILVLPSARIMVSQGEKLKAMVAESLEDMTEENCCERYARCLHHIVDALEEVLIGGGVSIETDVAGLFDPKKNRLLKTLVTNDPEMDRVIAEVHTECYVMNEKIVYPSKVDVYKFVAKSE